MFFQKHFLSVLRVCAVLALVSLPSCGWLGTVSIKGSNAPTTGTGTGGSDPTQGRDKLLCSTTGKLLGFNFPSSLATGACTQASVTAYQDCAATNVSPALSVTLTAPSSVLFYSDSACNTPILSLSIPNGAASQNFYVRGSNQGTFVVTGDGSTGGYSTTSTSIVVSGTSSQSPTHINLAGATSVKAGTCNQYLSYFLDANSLPAAFGSGTILNLAHNEPHGSFYSDANCSIPITAITLPQGGINLMGNTGATFYYKNTTVSSPTLSVTANSSTGQTTLNVYSGDPAKFAISGATSLNAGTCSAYQGTILDVFNNQTPVATAQAVNLQLSTGSPGSIYSDNSCSNMTSTASAAMSQSAFTFYYKSTTTGAAQLSANATGFVGTSIPITVTAPPPGTPAKLAFSQSSGTVPADACFGPITVIVKDSNDTPLPSASYIINLTNTQTGQFFATSDCQGEITNISTNSQFYFKDTIAHSNQLFANTNGLQGATLALNVTPGTRSKFIVSMPAASFAGVCQKVKVEATDAFGNPVSVSSATVLGFMEQDFVGGVGKFYSDASCASPLVNQLGILNAGESTLFVYFRETKTGTGKVKVADTSFTTVGTAIFQVLGAAPHHTVIVSPTSVSVSLCSASFILKLLDQYENETPALSSLSYALTSSNAGSFFTTSGCSGASVIAVTLPVGQSTVPFYFLPSNPGTTNGTATNATMSPTQTIFSFPVGGGAISSLLLAGISPLAATSPGRAVVGTCSRLRATLKDSAGGNATAASTMPFTFVTEISGGIHGGFYSDSACATKITTANIAANSSSIDFYVKNSVAETSNFMLMGSTLASNQYALQFIAGSPTSLSLLGSASGASAGECKGGFHVEVYDSFHNLSSVTAGTQINLSGANHGEFHALADCTDAPIAAVVYPATSFYFRDRTAENLTLTAQNPSLGNSTLPFTIRTGSASKLVFEGPQSEMVGHCSAGFKFKVTDDFGNNVTSTAVRGYGFNTAGFGVYSDPTCTTVTLGANIAANEVYTPPLYFKGSSVGSVNLLVSGTPPGTRAITILPDTTLPTVDLKVNGTDGPVTLSYNQTVALRWVATNVTSCSIDCFIVSGNLSWSGNSPPIKKSQDIVVKCTGPKGTATDKVTVNLDGGWYQVTGANCPNYCKTLGLINRPSAEGCYCASGENIPSSAVGIINYRYGTWPNSNPHLDPANQMSFGGNCYGSSQKHDGDRTDVTMGCYCGK